MRHLATAPLVAVAALFFAVACASAGDAEPSEISVAQLRSDYLRLSDDVRVAKTLLANECMLRQGFATLPVAQIPEASAADAIAGGQVARLRLTVDGARTSGYEATDEWQRRSRVDEREELARSLDRQIYDDSWGLAWFGSIGAPDNDSDGGGCFTAAGAQLLPAELGGSIQDALNQVSRLWSDVRSTAEQDHSYQSALESWTNCMSAAGFGPFRSLPEAFDVGTRRQTQDFDQALADASCQESSGVVDAFVDAWRRAESLVGQSREALAFADWEQQHRSTITATVYDALSEAGFEPSS